MGNERILIVEDDVDIRELTSLYLKKKGYDVLTADNGHDAVEIVNEGGPHLILLDVLLPGMEGFDVCKRIREKTETPIIFLSCKRSSGDKIKGLNAGGDDYMTKPFDLAELEARIKANLRRKPPEREASGGAGGRYLTHGPVSVDLNSFEVFRDGEKLSLFAKETQMLLFLMKNPNQVFSAEQIYNQIWGSDQFGDLKTVSVHIRNLRKKIERDPGKPEFIQTVRGFGYKFSPGN